MRKSQISVNGTNYTVSGSSIEIKNGVVRVDGKIVSDESKSQAIKIEITGDLMSLTCDLDVVCGNVAGNVDAGGSVECKDVQGFVDAGGSIECGNVGDYVDAGGSVKCGTVGGDVDAGGSVRHGG